MANLEQSDIRILIVEDELVIALDLQGRVEALGYTVCGAEKDGQGAVEAAGRERPDLVLMDIVLPGDLDGIQAAGIIKDRFAIPVVFITAYADPDRLDRARTALPFGYLVKPVRDRDLRVAIRMALYAARAEAERRRAEAALVESRDELDRAQALAHVGNYTRDLLRNETSWSKELGRIMGCPDEKPSFGRMVSLIHPEDSEAVLEAGRLAREDRRTFDMEYRIIRPDGAIRWIRDQGRIEWDESGAPVRMFGTVQDITGFKQAEEARRGKKEIEALLRASRAVIQIHEFPEAARELFAAAKGLIGATAGYVALLNESGHGNEVLFLDSGGRPCRVDPSLPMPVRGLREAVCRSGRPAYENRFPDSPWLGFIPEGHMALENVLFAPLTMEGRVAGLLGLANKPGGFSDRDADLAAAFAEFASIALANSLALTRSEERFRTLIDHAPDPIYVQTDTRFAYVNEAALRLFRAGSADDLLARPVLERVAPEDRAVAVERIERINVVRETLPLIERTYLTLEGGPVTAEVSSVPIDYEGKAGALVFLRDVTERKRAEAALRRRVEFETVAAGLSATFLDLQALEAKIDAALEAVGRFCRADRAYLFRMRDAGTADNTNEWCAPGIEAQIQNLQGLDLAAELPWFWNVLRGRRVFRVPSLLELPAEAALEKGHFQAQDIQSLAVVPMAVNEKLIGFIGFDWVGPETAWPEDVVPLLRFTGETISHALDRARSEDALRRSETELFAIYQNAPVIMILFDADPRVLKANRAALEFSGLDPVRVIGIPCGDVLGCVNARKDPRGCGFSPDCPDCLVRRTIGETRARGMDRYRVEASLCLERGQGPEQRTMLVSSSLLDVDGRRLVLVSLEDVTGQRRAEADREALETRLRQAQKMEAIGTLAGGIAHDFNNILAAMVGYTELAMMSGRKGADIKRHLEQVLLACGRARDLVRQILDFSRRGEEEYRPVVVNSIVEEALKMLRSTLPTTIEIRADLDPAPMSVQGDPTRIHQVIMNLGANAAQAMSRNGGVLSVRLAPLEPLPPSPASDGQGPPRPQVRIAVSDTGHGMTAETMARIYEPFFTTKGPGEGTGMGLAVVYGIVKSHQGEITVQSEPGQGTVFHVDLPLADAPGRADGREEPEAIPVGTEHILFVDDESALSTVNRDILRHLGYRVTSLTSSLDALAMFRERPDDFDLVVTDQTMPYLTGIDLARAIMTIRPDAPVILCTGFSHQIDAKTALRQGIRRFLMKPFAVRDVAEAIRSVLDEKAIRPARDES
ncbi:MAG: response regulator [Proteobacteria bacterium]|nr:response regulator [Pseudomonadota bacterium]